MSCSAVQCEAVVCHSDACRPAGVDGVSDSPDQGPWLLCLDNSIVNVFLQFSERRDLREKVYRYEIGAVSLSSLLSP